MSRQLGLLKLATSQRTVKRWG